MADHPLQQVFFESAAEVLETMCFMGVLGQSAALEHGELVSAEVSFHGTPSGLFGVQVSTSTAKLIASNFLGQEAEAITEAQGEQVMGELANMICGSVLSRAEAGARFELSHPVIGQPGAGRPPEAIHYTLELEEGFIVLWIATAESIPACPAA